MKKKTSEATEDTFPATKMPLVAAANIAICRMEYLLDMFDAEPIEGEGGEEMLNPMIDMKNQVELLRFLMPKLVR